MTSMLLRRMLSSSSLSTSRSCASLARMATPLVTNSLPTLRTLLNDYSHCTPQGVTLEDLYLIGTMPNTLSARLISAQWLQRELPVRLARRVKDLESLESLDGLGWSRGVRRVKEMYEASFADVIETGILVENGDMEAFAKVLEGVRRRHKDVVATMARGILEWKAEMTTNRNHEVEIKRFLDRFYMSRIGIRVLISHFLELGTKRKGFAGVINKQCRPAEMAEKAASVARNLAYAHFGEAPEVQILGNSKLKFPYVDTHIYLCLFELLKNSLRATVETHRDEDRLPPVKVIIADGQEDITLKISDEGGGIPRSSIDRIWTYMFTTADIPPDQLLMMEDNNKRSNNSRPDPIAGFGYGLPLSKLYARYFGGELSVLGMEGYGTDAYLHLCKLGNKKESVV